MCSVLRAYRYAVLIFTGGYFVVELNARSYVHRHTPRPTPSVTLSTAARGTAYYYCFVCGAALLSNALLSFSECGAVQLRCHVALDTH